MKPAKACQQCRSSKRKCVQIPSSSTHTGCISCHRRRLKCSRASLRNPSNANEPQKLVSLSSVHPNVTHEPDQPLPLSKDLIFKFVDLYMQFVHDRPHTLFHEKTLMADIRAETVSESLLAAICAMGCRFSASSYHCELAIDFRMKSSSLFSQELEKISLSNIQTCILLANLYAAEQDYGLEVLYFGIANRMARVLRLHESHTDDPPVLREIKCRVWWTLYMADRWCPPGLGLPREIVSPSQSMELPMDESEFQNMNARTTANRPSGLRGGLWKYMITLADILGPIQDLNHSLVQNTYLQNEVDGQVAYLSQCLSDWFNTLPEHMTMNDENLELYSNNGHGGTFIALHLGYHHYSTLLYFQYLDLTVESTPDTIFYADRCRHHALRFSKLISTARTKQNCQVVYLTVAHMTMVSSSVLLHLLLFGNSEEEVQTARVQLTSNFEALVELRKYWPRMDKITKRLLTFQDSCLRFTGTKTYKVDSWMVRFLLEHALPFEGKDGSDLEDDSVDSYLHRPHNSDVPLERTSMLNEAFADLYT